jgi:hypothetical protein
MKQEKSSSDIPSTSSDIPSTSTLLSIQEPEFSTTMKQEKSFSGFPYIDTYRRIIQYCKQKQKDTVYCTLKGFTVY